MTASLFIEQLTFSGGASIALEPDSIVVIVGPNNEGKSATLREILGRSGAVSSEKSRHVVTDMKIGHRGTAEAFLERLAPYRLPGGKHYALTALQDANIFSKIKPSSIGGSSLLSPDPKKIRESILTAFWEQQPGFESLSGTFFHLLDLATRFKATEPADVFNLTAEIPTSPIQNMCVDPVLADRLSRYFQRAFGQALIVNRTAGYTLPLHCGDVPPLEPGEDRVSPSYARKLQALPLLQNQGDGMRSFAGCLLEVSAADKHVVMIDEPEAFLHPPQARFLGTLLAREKPVGRQLIIATHSGDLLRGLLDANPSALQIIRLTREGNVNHACALDSERIRTLWDDPILRFSNTLDSLFHEQVVLCEADGDCRFYAAILDAIQPEDADTRRPDVMFTSTGGKQKIPEIAAALASIGVPTRAILDFDILNDRSPLKEAIEALGGRWDAFEARWKRVKAGVEQFRPELETAHVRKEIEKLLEQVSTPTFPLEVARSIKGVLKRASPWDAAKDLGLDTVPKGQLRQVAEALLADLKQLGLFVVESGEIESFDQTVGGHGNAWLAEVLRKDLRQDSHLENARRFVRALFSQPPRALS
ncbi:ATP-binding protein [Corallococcus macrosporus]|uniref:ATP-binding protein n=1 Tax=Corallococcus macrosporus TaxID=35 RepID=A0ABS3D8J9_9BACT|nr:AAA family ATPase [Corallococcus macrosporus]MBN8227977.1 ATP-binding protein [Corallococcus macrosporus]